MERKTWPLTKSQWGWVEKLKEAEKEELKAFSGKLVEIRVNILMYF